MIARAPHFYTALQAYIRELDGPVPVVSYSHYTLRNLYLCFGKRMVDRALDRYWNIRRARG